MPHSRKFSSQRRTGSRRMTAWSEGPNSSAVQTLSAAGASLWDTGQALTEPGLTIVRIRGELLVWLSTVTTVGDGFTKFSAGIGIVNADAFAVGATAIPSPADDDDWPGWMWHHAGAGLIGLETTEVGRFPLNGVRIPIDTKAMRVMKQNEVIVGVVAVETEIGTSVLRFIGNTRMLSKLS